MSSEKMNELIDKVNELDNRATVIVHQPDTTLSWKEIAECLLVTILVGAIIAAIVFMLLP